ncbi:MAG: hypothetical protein JNN17_25425 [Verrucomicrobiaceae bacterium]|nr:hypothetical protein [Verrucomicrobiaceae bacterium]
MLLRSVLLCLSLFSASCQYQNTLMPSWQQDTTLIYNGQAAALAQQATTPHLVARAVYAAPGHIEKLLAKQDDSPAPVQQLAVMGDGTFALGFSDAATGQFLDVQECGGMLFVTGLHNQAYRIHIQNLTPMPLDLAIGIDGKDICTGREASWSRSSLRVAAKQSLLIDHPPHGKASALLFGKVQGDQALFETHPSGTKGLIQVAAWLSRDAPSVPGQTLRPTQYPPLNLLPGDQPVQYR